MIRSKVFIYVRLQAADDERVMGELCEYNGELWASYG